MIDVVGYGSFQRPLSAMHDDRAMSTTHGTRLSVGELPHPLQTVPTENHTSVIKKIDHSVESILPSSKPSADRNNFGFVHHITDTYGGNANEALLDDDFSDHDSHYSEDFEDDIQDDIPPEPDVTRQLLDFADMVSCDIQKFFGRKKGEEDSCDIYEDKWYSAKSGRELYYADLMKIVHGDDKKGSSNSSPLLDISNSVKENRDNRNSFSGKLDEKLGIGPLNELFEYGLRHVLSDRKHRVRELKRLKADVKKFSDVRPMQERKLPSSFWREPGSQQTNIAVSRSSAGNSLLQTNNPPDFSDLLESWRLDRNEFNGEMSSSEVSMSPESV